MYAGNAFDVPTSLAAPKPPVLFDSALWLRDAAASGSEYVKLVVAPGFATMYSRSRTDALDWRTFDRYVVEKAPGSAHCHAQRHFWLYVVCAAWKLQRQPTAQRCFGQRVCGVLQFSVR